MSHAKLPLLGWDNTTTESSSRNSTQKNRFLTIKDHDKHNAKNVKTMVEITFEEYARDIRRRSSRTGNYLYYSILGTFIVVGSKKVVG